MIRDTFTAVIYEPIYNSLALIVSVIPGGDVGIAIIVVTLLVKALLFPLSMRASKTQIAMRTLDPKLREIKEKHKDNRELLARETMALFKEHKVNPFSGFLLILIQIPIILGLYFVFLGEGNGATFDPAILYSFVPSPENVSFSFLGVIDLTGKSIALAVLVAITQFFYARLTMPVAPAATGSQFRDDFAKSLHIQMRYVFPLVFGVIAYYISAAIALYFATSNIFGIVHELIVKRMHHGETAGS